MSKIEARKVYNSLQNIYKFVIEMTVENIFFNYLYNVLICIGLRSSNYLCPCSIHMYKLVLEFSRKEDGE